MGNAGTISEARLKVPASLSLEDDQLALFVLNVGDGDALIVRFPVEHGSPSYAVVDSFLGPKTIGLLNDLQPGPIRFVCATHPHFDHIRGLRAVLRRFRGQVTEFWDSGFRYTSTTYRALLEEVMDQAREGLRFVRPTSGYELFHAGAMITVLSPSIQLRNRYDTHGVDVNNSSIVLRISYPARRPSEDYPAKVGQLPDPPPKGRTIILGGDAQTDAWGQVMQEFPHLARDDKNWARQIGAGGGAQPLACDLFKVAHHSSKRGINLELLERFGDRTGAGPSKGPRWLVSSCASESDSSYGFPHTVTHALMREVRDPQAQKGGTHPPDDQLGIHFTSQRLDPGPGAAGSIAYVIGGDASAQLFRFGDEVGEDLDLTAARRAS
ncbi:MAG: MBL fold metallo-hydrolase [Chloroflexi bacterium]|nr:MBL fold metallo-hydrolase [Chloroflexota bacterium]